MKLHGPTAVEVTRGGEPIPWVSTDGRVTIEASGDGAGPDEIWGAPVLYPLSAGFLRIVARPGVVCRIERAETLGFPTAWKTVGELGLDAKSVDWRDPEAGSGRAFYRARLIDVPAVGR